MCRSSHRVASTAPDAVRARLNRTIGVLVVPDTAAGRSDFAEVAIGRRIDVGEEYAMTRRTIKHLATGRG